MHSDIRSLLDQLDQAGGAARELILGLTKEQGAWRAAPGSWSVAQCFTHLAVTDTQYVAAMDGSASRARSRGRLRRDEARPGWFGRWFTAQLEPPVKPRRKITAPEKIRPRPDSTIGEAYTAFVAGQQLVREFIETNADLDLNSILFANPFVPGLRFSLASGIQIVLAHERRHLWQAEQIIRMATQLS